MSQCRFFAERIRVQRRPHTDVRQQFPSCWNLLNDEQHRTQRRGYVLRDMLDDRLAGAVVVQFHQAPGGLRIWVNQIRVAEHLSGLVDLVERCLIGVLQENVTAWEAPLLMLVVPERTDFLRRLGFVAWQIHRALPVPAVSRPVGSEPAFPAQPTNPDSATTETTTPPRLTDCWAMIWIPQELETAEDVT